MPSHHVQAADRGVPLGNKIEQIKRETASSGQDIQRAFVCDIWPGLWDEYEEMMKSLKKHCEKSLKQRHITCRVEGRTKTVESVEKSLDRRKQEQKQYESLDVIFREMHDLVGLRIVLDFPGDIEKADGFIQKSFHPEKEPAVFSPDREVGQSWKTWFGAYQTRNHRVSLRNETDGALSRFCGVMFEMQLTTVAESLYNRFAHDLLYKGSSGPLTRKDEMVIDLAHGLSLCYGLCLLYMQEKLESTCNRVEVEEGGGALAATTEESESVVVHNIVAGRDRFFENLTRGMNGGLSGKPYRFEDLPKASGTPPVKCHSINDLKGWLSRELEHGIPESLRTLQQLLSVDEKHLRVTEEQLQFQKDKAKQKKEEKCHQLFFLTADSNGNTYKEVKERVENRVEGTCQWFLHHEHFKRWLWQDAGPLLVSADPGCGKSVLAKHLIDEALPRAATICYFFFKDQDQNTVRQALCALLHQLFSQKRSLIEHATKQFDKDGPGLINSTMSLWAVLENAIQDPQAGPTIMVLDALDECAKSDFRDLVRMLKGLFLRDRHGHSKMKCLLTSRPYGHIVSEFQELVDAFPCIHIPGEEESDTISKEVNHVIQHRVEQLATDMKLSEKIKDHIAQRLLEIQHRTYLWVYLVFDYLREGFIKTPKGVETTIATLPTSVNQAYEQILSKSREHPMVRKAMCIILAASRPLTLSEMNVAVNVDEKSQSIHDLDLEEEEDFKSRLRSWCGLFVSIYHGKIYFLHQTAREFLLTKVLSPATVPSELSWYHSITVHHAHTVLAELCVLYLNFFNSAVSVLPDVNMEASHYADSHAFLDYSAKNWGTHLCEANISDDAATVLLALKICDPDSKAYSVWFKFVWEAYGQTPLSWAARDGQEAVVQLLLDRGADLESKDNDGRTPLSLAAGRGKEAVVQLLLDRGADLESKNNDGWTPLSLAAGEGKEAVMQLLLDRGADLESKDNDGRTPLSLAAGDGQEAVVRLLRSIQ